MSEQQFPGVEPSADGRAMARAIRDMYVALRKEGFTEQQTLVLIGHSISAASSANGGVQDE